MIKVKMLKYVLFVTALHHLDPFSVSAEEEIVADYHEDYMSDMYHNHGEDFYGDMYGYDDYFYSNEFGYHTHGSLLIDDVDAFKEFMDMDQLEAAVIAFFPHQSIADLEHDDEYLEFKRLALEYSHLARFAHCNSQVVAMLDELNLNPSKTTVLVAPAKKLNKVHLSAGLLLEYPGEKIKQEPLKKFIFHESAPLIDQYDWRSVERASVLDMPIITVFASMYELHHSYHTEVLGEKETSNIKDLQQQGIETATKSLDGSEREGVGEHQSEHLPWTFDELASSLFSSALEFQHDIQFLVANKHDHQIDMSHYNIQIPERESHIFGIGIKLDDLYYSKVVVLPVERDNTIDLGLLKIEVQNYVELFFEGKLEVV